MWIELPCRVDETYVPGRHEIIKCLWILTIHLGNSKHKPKICFHKFVPCPFVSLESHTGYSIFFVVRHNRGFLQLPDIDINGSGLSLGKSLTNLKLSHRVILILEILPRSPRFSFQSLDLSRRKFYFEMKKIQKRSVLAAILLHATKNLFSVITNGLGQ